MDIPRLNFAVLALIPKVQGADYITSFRSTTLINVIFKLIIKLSALRLDHVGSHIVGMCQSAFIEGCHIMRGSYGFMKSDTEIESGVPKT